LDEVFDVLIVVDEVFDVLNPSLRWAIAVANV